MKSSTTVISPMPTYDYPLDDKPDTVLVTAVGKCVCKIASKAVKGELYGPTSTSIDSTYQSSTSCRTPGSFSSGNVDRYFKVKEREILERHAARNSKHVEVKQIRCISDEVRKGLSFSVCKTIYKSV
jgi:hypothetical protein